MWRPRFFGERVRRTKARARGTCCRDLPGGSMHRLTFLSFASFLAPLTLAAQARPIVPHDSVRGSIRAVDVRTPPLEVTTGVGFAIRVVRSEERRVGKECRYWRRPANVKEK